jgi:uncharacterized protein YkwD
VAGRYLLAGIAGVAVLLALSVLEIGAAAGAAPERATAEKGKAGIRVAEDRRHAGRARPPKRRARCRTGRRQRLGSKRRTVERRRALRRRAPQRRRGRRNRPCRRPKRAPRKIQAPAPTLPSVPPPAWLPALPPPAPVPPPTAPAPPGSCLGSDAVPTAANLPAIRAATLCLVNTERAGAGILPLVDHSQLAAAAQGHADDMAAQGYFDHTSRDGRTFDQRIRNAGYVGTGMAENIAWGSSYLGTPRRIVGAWMNSPGHRANILNGAWSDSGIGVAPRTPTRAAGGTYVHDFGAP